MAGSSAITLFRSSDATINIGILARQAARILAAELGNGVVTRLKLRNYPETGTPLFQITDLSSPVDGCVLDVVSEGVCRLTIPMDFWDDKPGRRFSIECFLETPDTEQRVGEVLIDVTE